MQDSNSTARSHARQVSLTAFICLSLFMVLVMSPSFLYAKKGKGSGGSGGDNSLSVVVTPPPPAPAPPPAVAPVPGPAPFVPSALTGPDFGDVTLPPAERPQAFRLWRSAIGLGNIPPVLVLADLNSGEILNLGHRNFSAARILVLMNDRLLASGSSPNPPTGFHLDAELWEYTQMPGQFV